MRDCGCGDVVCDHALSPERLAANGICSVIVGGAGTSISTGHAWTGSDSVRTTANDSDRAGATGV